MSQPHEKSVFLASSPAQRKALTSPVRQEILGHFAGTDGLSVTELAERMGRPPTALYYHVTHLAELGFLEVAGERRKGKRYESLYRPAAEMYEIDMEQDKSDEDVVRTLEIATRTSVREVRDALEGGRGKTEGPDRNLIGFRLQGPLDRETLEKVNEHIDAILDVVSGSCADGVVKADAEFISLSLVLAPLRGRNSRRDS